jgi:F0F1-type ATP synthase membrane subunit b/b'
MGDLYMDALNYNNYLSSALNQSAQIEQETQQQLANLQQFAAGKTEQKELSGELLFTTLPGVFPEVGRAVQAGAKIFKGIQDLQAKGSSIVEGLKTLPDDLKTIAGSKIDQVNKLVSDGTAKSLAQAKQIVEDIKSQGEGLKTQASQLIDTAKENIANVADVANREVSNATELLQNQGSSAFRDVQKSTTELAQEAFGGLKDEVLNQGVNVVEKATQGIQDIKSSLPLPLSEGAKTTEVQFDNPLFGQSKVGEIVKSQSELENERLTNWVFSRPSGEIKSMFPEVQSSSIVQTVPTQIREVPQKVKFTQKAPSDIDINNYNNAKSNADSIQSRLLRETDPSVRADLQLNLKEAQTTLSSRSRLLQLGDADQSILSRLGSGVGSTLNVGGGILSTIEEAKGQIKGAGQRAQTTIMQSQATEELSQRGAQAVKAGQEAFGGTEKAAQQAGTELSQQTAGIAKSAQASLDTAKSGLSELAENVGEKGTDILGSIAEKGVLETLGEVTGLTAIPVVGEIAGVGALAWGAIEGIKDLFSHTSAPKPMVVQQAGLVRQAGI